MCLSSGKSQTALDIPLDQNFIQKGESVLLISFVVVFLCSVFYLMIVFVFSYWWIQRVSGVQSGRQTFAVQHQGAHRQQSLLQQSAARLRQQVSECSSVSEQKLSKSSHGERAVMMHLFECFHVLCCFRVCVRSRCWDACMVVDGGTSFEFNDGAIATISMSDEDQLRTVLLEHWDESGALHT